MLWSWKGVGVASEKKKLKRTKIMSKNGVKCFFSGYWLNFFLWGPFRGYVSWGKKSQGGRRVMIEMTNIYHWKKSLHAKGERSASHNVNCNNVFFSCITIWIYLTVISYWSLMQTNMFFLQYIMSLSNKNLKCIWNNV